MQARRLPPGVLIGEMLLHLLLQLLVGDRGHPSFLFVLIHHPLKDLDDFRDAEPLIAFETEEFVDPEGDSV